MSADKYKKIKPEAFKYEDIESQEELRPSLVIATIFASAVAYVLIMMLLGVL